MTCNFLWFSLDPRWFAVVAFPLVTQRLHQIIALEKGARAAAAEAFVKAQRDCQRTAQQSGIARTYTPKADGGDPLPSESTLVQVKVDKILADVAGTFTRLFDLVATKEQADTAAFADVKVGDTVLMQRVPVTYLLFLEKQLTGLRTFAKTLPTLDPAEQWRFDAGQGVWVTEPVETNRTKKVKKSITLYDATKEHPAQVLPYDEDEIVGTWKTIKTSGALQQTRVAQLIGRIDQLLDAVKVAREEANSVEVDDRRDAQRLFDFILAE